MTNLMSQKMGIHEWSYDNAITLDKRFKVPHSDNAIALKNIATEVELGFDPIARDIGGATLPQLRCADRILRADLHRVRRLRRYLSGRLHFLRRATAPKSSCGIRSMCRPSIFPRRSTFRSPVKTGRVMVKDEDLCLHCGLCAERCPTGAWDMQKFTIEMAQAGQACPSKP